jgi:Flp pilus assembly protein TadG
MKRSHARSRRGSVLVEMTMALPFLSLLFVGTWQFGRAFWLYSELENAVRAGARYASNRIYSSSTETPTADFVNAVKNTVVYGDAFTNTGTPVVANLTADNVQITISGFAVQNAPEFVRVCIIGNYDLGTFWHVQVNGKPCAEFSYVGIYSGDE